jgi:hypothetical protein
MHRAKDHDPEIDVAGFQELLSLFRTQMTRPAVIEFEEILTIHGIRYRKLPFYALVEHMPEEG